MSAPRTESGQSGGVRPDPIVLGPVMLALLSDHLASIPLVRRELDTYLEALKLDPSKKWQLGITAAVLVAEDGAPPAAGERDLTREGFR